MKSYPMVILGGGVVAGYAAKEFVAQSGKEGELAIVTAENALPYERPPLSKGFLAGKEEADDIQISDAAFYRKHGIDVYRNFPVGKVDFHRHRLQGPSGKVIGFDRLLIATGSTVRRLKVPGANRSEVLYLRQMKDSQAIQAQIKRGKRAVVIGSGFIGMEVASVLATPSCMVPLKMTPIDRAPWDFAALSNNSSMEGIQCSRFGAPSSDTPTVLEFTTRCRRGWAT